MRNNFFKAIILAFWLLMNGWLVRYEAFPEKFSEAMSGYRALLRSGPLILDSWMQIECQGSPIGYSHSWIDTSLEYDAAAYTLKNQTFLNFKFMGQGQWVGVNADAVLDDQYDLQRFSAVMFSSLYSTRVEGRRSRKGSFDVIIKTAAAEKRFELEIPEDVVLYSPMLETAMRRLSPGQTLRIKTIDPLSLNVADVMVEAVRREKMAFDGQMLDTTVLNILYSGMNVTSWIDDQGRVLRQETPFGWIMRAATPREILSRRKQSFEGADLFAAMAVPVRGQLLNPRQSRMLRVRLNGRLPDTVELESSRQAVKERLVEAVILELAAQPEPANSLRLGAQMPPELNQFLAPSASLQCDSEKIIKQAKEITTGSATCYQAALAINEWVYRHIIKKPTVSLPSALDVLQRREGDCNEHTYLFVALARAAGLPAKINVGLVYAEPDAQPAAFYYHAWPSVYVGQWVEMDPTLGVPLVAAAYIRLITGEINDQLQLLGIIGRLSADVIEERSQNSEVSSQ